MILAFLARLAARYGTCNALKNAQEKVTNHCPDSSIFRHCGGHSPRDTLIDTKVAPETLRVARPCAQSRITVHPEHKRSRGKSTAPQCWTVRVQRVDGQARGVPCFFQDRARQDVENETTRMCLWRVLKTRWGTYLAKQGHQRTLTLADRMVRSFRAPVDNDLKSHAPRRSSACAQMVYAGIHWAHGR